MKLTEFQKKMPLSVFTSTDVARLAWETSPATLRLQLHQWAKSGAIVRLRRGVYGFPERITDKTVVAKTLYGPAYISLESALHHHGLLPDVVFATTLVTPKTTRRFQTPFGLFLYHHIKTGFFWGYDPDTLMASPEKAVVDFFHLYGRRLQPTTACWEELRWQNLDSIDFRRARRYAEKIGIPKVIALVKSLSSYGTT